MVLGLSLTSEEIVWVLVDGQGTVVDHDSVEFQADAEIGSAAARGAHAIATAGGLEVETLRLTWSDDVARDGLRLRSHLACLGFDNVEAVPLRCAGAVLVDPDMEPALALAYGAARAEVGLADAITVPVCTRQTPKRFRRGRMALAVLGAAAAAAAGALLLTSGSLPHAEQTAAAASPSAVSEPGWVAVPAPSDSAARTVRKVVDEPEVDVPQAPAVVEPVLAVPVVAPPAVEAAPVLPAPAVEAAPVAQAPVVAEPMAAPVPAEAPHLPEGTPHLEPVPVPEAIPTAQPHLVDEQPALGPAPEMTDPANLFTAVP